MKETREALRDDLRGSEVARGKAFERFNMVVLAMNMAAISMDMYMYMYAYMLQSPERYVLISFFHCCNLQLGFRLWCML